MIKSIVLLWYCVLSFFSAAFSRFPMIRSSKQYQVSNINTFQRSSKKKSCNRQMMSMFNPSRSEVSQLRVKLLKEKHSNKNKMQLSSLRESAMRGVSSMASSSNGKVFVKTAIHVTSEVASHMMFPKSAIGRAVTSVALKEGVNTLIEQATENE